MSDIRAVPLPAVADARFRELFDSSPVPQALMALDGRIGLVNEAYCELVGMPREELAGRPAESLMHVTDPFPDGPLREALAGGRQSTGHRECVIRRGDGVAVPVYAHASLIHDEHGVPDGMACVVYDLTTLRTAEAELHRRDSLFNALAARASDTAVVVAPDGRVLYASPTAMTMFGYQPDDVLDLVGWDFIHPDDLPDFFTACMSGLDTLGASVTATFRARDALGEWRWVEEVVTNLVDDPDIGGMVLNIRDVTERVVAEQALRESEAWYRAIVETAQEGVLATDPDGRVVFANQKLADLIGRPLEHLHGVDGLALFDDAGPGLAARIGGRAGERGGQYEIRHRHPERGERVLALATAPLADDAGHPLGRLTMVTDVTEARRAEQELRRQALRDHLTGLANRALFADRLAHALERQARRGGGSTAVVFADLDHFKLVNDSLGHAAGDELLVTVAGRLSASVRPGDTVARFGGDEFVVLCEDADLEAATAVAQRLLAVLAEPVDVAGQQVYVNASIGIALSPPADAEELLRHADAAMYDAKARGRSRVSVFDTALAAQARRRLELSSELRRAIAADELALHYQPIVGLASGRLLGLEALARWQHPEHGAIPPTEFVAIAEESGLVAALDGWALRRACVDAARMRADGVLPPDGYVAVNVSALGMDDGLEGRVHAAVAAAGLPWSALVVELTESAVMADPATARGLLQRLSELGVRVAIDDFGTGYSSLAHLRRFPVTTLKIDRSFVRHLPAESEDLAIVAAIVELAAAMGLHTVAEGIETAEQLAVLCRLGCPAGQGYLWSRPVPADELPRLLAVGLAAAPAAAGCCAADGAGCGSGPSAGASSDAG